MVPYPSPSPPLWVLDREKVQGKIKNSWVLFCLRSIIVPVIMCAVHFVFVLFYYHYELFFFSITDLPNLFICIYFWKYSELFIWNSGGEIISVKHVAGKLCTHQKDSDVWNNVNTGFRAHFLFTSESTINWVHMHDEHHTPSLLCPTFNAKEYKHAWAPPLQNVARFVFPKYLP